MEGLILSRERHGPYSKPNIAGWKCEDCHHGENAAAVL